jgi:hypothetical protein
MIVVSGHFFIGILRVDLIRSLGPPLGRREKGRLLLQAAKTKNPVLLQTVLQFPEVNVNVCDKRGDTTLFL